MGLTQPSRMIVNDIPYTIHGECNHTHSLRKVMLSDSLFTQQYRYGIVRYIKSKGHLALPNMEAWSDLFNDAGSTTCAIIDALSYFLKADRMDLAYASLVPLKQVKFPETDEEKDTVVSQFMESYDLCCKHLRELNFCITDHHGVVCDKTVTQIGGISRAVESVESTAEVLATNATTVTNNVCVNADTVTNSIVQVSESVQETSKSVQDALKVFTEKFESVSGAAERTLDKVQATVDTMQEILSSTKEAQTLYNKVIMNPHRLALHVANICQTKTMTHLTTEVISLLCYLELDRKVIDRFISKKDEPVVEAGEWGSTVELIAIIASLAGLTIPSLKNFHLMDVYKMQKNSEAMVWLQEKILRVLSDWGIYTSDSIVFEKTTQDKITRLNEELAYFKVLLSKSVIDILSASNTSRFTKAYDEVRSLHKGMPRTDRSTSHVYNLYMGFENIKGEIEKMSAATSTRPTTIGVAFIGAQYGIGKSTLVMKIKELLARRQAELGDTSIADYDFKSWNVYADNANDEYDSNYHGEEIHMIDDFNARKDDVDHVSLLQRLSDSPTTILSPIAERKGAAYTSLLCLASCNAFPRVSRTIENVGALDRRFQIKVEVEGNKPELNGQFDLSFSHLTLKIDHRGQAKTGLTALVDSIIAELKWAREHYNASIDSTYRPTTIIETHRPMTIKVDYCDPAISKLPTSEVEITKMETLRDGMCATRFIEAFSKNRADIVEYAFEHGIIGSQDNLTRDDMFNLASFVDVLLVEVDSIPERYTVNCRSILFAIDGNHVTFGVPSNFTHRPEKSGPTFTDANQIPYGISFANKEVDHLTSSCNYVIKPWGGLTTGIYERNGKFIYTPGGYQRSFLMGGLFIKGEIGHWTAGEFAKAMETIYIDGKPLKKFVLSKADNEKVGVNTFEILKDAKTALNSECIIPTRIVPDYANTPKKYNKMTVATYEAALLRLGGVTLDVFEDSLKKLLEVLPQREYNKKTLYKAWLRYALDKQRETNILKDDQPETVWWNTIKANICDCLGYTITGKCDACQPTFNAPVLRTFDPEMRFVNKSFYRIRLVTQADVMAKMSFYDIIDLSYRDFEGDIDPGFAHYSPAVGKMLTKVSWLVRNGARTDTTLECYYLGKDDTYGVSRPCYMMIDEEDDVHELWYVDEESPYNIKYLFNSLIHKLVHGYFKCFEVCIRPWEYLCEIFGITGTSESVFTIIFGAITFNCILKVCVHIWTNIITPQTKQLLGYECSNAELVRENGYKAFKSLEGFVTKLSKTQDFTMLKDHFNEWEFNCDYPGHCHICDRLTCPRLDALNELIEGGDLEPKVGLVLLSVDAHKHENGLPGIKDETSLKSMFWSTEKPKNSYVMDLVEGLASHFNLNRRGGFDLDLIVQSVQKPTDITVEEEDPQTEFSFFSCRVKPLIQRDASGVELATTARCLFGCDLCAHLKKEMPQIWLDWNNNSEETFRKVKDAVMAAYETFPGKTEWESGRLGRKVPSKKKTILQMNSQDNAEHQLRVDDLTFANPLCKEVKDALTSVPAFVRPVSMEAGQDAAAYDLAKKVHSNYVRVECRTFFTMGVGSGNRVIMPNHIVLDPNEVEIFYQGKKLKITAIYRVPRSDIAIAEVTHKFANIDRHFITEDMFANMEDRVRAIQACPSQDRFRLQDRCLNPCMAVKQAREFSGDGIQYARVIHTSCTSSQFTQFAPATAQGDCGSLLIATNSNLMRKILGFHIASSYCNGIVQVVTYETLSNGRLIWRAPITQYGITEKIPPTFDIGKYDRGEIIKTKSVFPVYDGAEYLSEYSYERPRLDVTADYIGEVKAITQPGITAFRRHIFYGAFKETKRPAHLKTSQCNVHNLVTDCTGDYNLMSAQSRKWSIPNDLSPEYVDFCDDFSIEVQRLLEDHMSGGTFRKATALEFLNGNRESDLVEGVNLNSSAGYYWSKYATTGKPGKQWLATPVEIKGKIIKFFDTANPGVSELSNFLHLYESLARNGVRLMDPYQNCLKDEPRELSKVDKPRIFTMSSVATLYMNFKYFAYFRGEFQRTRINMYHSYGLNPHSPEVENLDSFLRHAGSQGFGLDYSSFDGKFPAPMIWAIGKGITRFIAKETNCSSSDSLARLTLFDNFINSAIVEQSHLWFKHRGVPSGDFWTTVMNCLGNIGNFSFVCRKILNKSLQAASNDVRLSVYGDDVIVAVSSRVEQDFNYQTVKSVITQHIGYAVTNEAKDPSREELYTVVPLEEVGFLSRRMVRWEGLMIGQLQKSSIEQQFSWTAIKPGMTMEICNQIEEACIEAAIHGESYYDDFCDRLYDAAANHLDRIVFRSSIPSYRDVVAKIKSRYGILRQEMTSKHGISNDQRAASYLNTNGVYPGEEVSIVEFVESNSPPSEEIVKKEERENKDQQEPVSFEFKQEPKSFEYRQETKSFEHKEKPVSFKIKRNKIDFRPDYLKKMPKIQAGVKQEANIIQPIVNPTERKFTRSDQGTNVTARKIGYNAKVTGGEATDLWDAEYEPINDYGIATVKIDNQKIRAVCSGPPTKPISDCKLIHGMRWRGKEFDGYDMNDGVRAYYYRPEIDIREKSEGLYYGHWRGHRLAKLEAPLELGYKVHFAVYIVTGPRPTQTPSCPSFEWNPATEPTLHVLLQYASASTVMPFVPVGEYFEGLLLIPIAETVALGTQSPYVPHLTDIPYGTCYRDRGSFESKKDEVWLKTSKTFDVTGNNAIVASASAPFAMIVESVTELYAPKVSIDGGFDQYIGKITIENGDEKEECVFKCGKQDIAGASDEYAISVSSLVRDVEEQCRIYFSNDNVQGKCTITCYGNNSVSIQKLSFKDGNKLIKRDRETVVKVQSAIAPKQMNMRTWGTVALEGEVKHFQIVPAELPGALGRHYQTCAYVKGELFVELETLDPPTTSTLIYVAVSHTNSSNPVEHRAVVLGSSQKKVLKVPVLATFNESVDPYSAMAVVSVQRVLLRENEDTTVGEIIVRVRADTLEGYGFQPRKDIVIRKFQELITPPTPDKTMGKIIPRSSMGRKKFTRGYEIQAGVLAEGAIEEEMAEGETAGSTSDSIIAKGAGMSVMDNLTDVIMKPIDEAEEKGLDWVENALGIETPEEKEERIEHAEQRAQMNPLSSASQKRRMFVQDRLTLYPGQPVSDDSDDYQNLENVHIKTCLVPMKPKDIQGALHMNERAFIYNSHTLGLQLNAPVGAATGEVFFSSKPLEVADLDICPSTSFTVGKTAVIDVPWMFPSDRLLIEDEYPGLYMTIRVFSASPAELVISGNWDKVRTSGYASIPHEGTSGYVWADVAGN